MGLVDGQTDSKKLHLYLKGVRKNLTNAHNDTHSLFASGGGKCIFVTCNSAQFVDLSVYFVYKRYLNNTHTTGSGGGSANGRRTKKGHLIISIT